MNYKTYIFERLVESLKVIEALPTKGVRPKGIYVVWADMALERTSSYSDDTLSKMRRAYGAKHGSGQYVSGAVTEAITRAEESLLWPLHVSDQQNRRALMLCVKTRAFGRKLSRVCAAENIARATLYRRRDKALREIEQVLSRKGDLRERAELDLLRQNAGDRWPDSLKLGEI